MAELEGVMDDEWIVGEEGVCQKARKHSYWAPLKTSILLSLMSSLENRIGANNVGFEHQVVRRSLGTNHRRPGG